MLKLLFQKHDYNMVYSKIVLSCTGRLISSSLVPREKKALETGLAAKRARHLCFFVVFFFWLTCFRLVC